MKLVNHRGSAALLVNSGVVDIARASAGQFGPGIHDVLEDWPAFVAWASEPRPYDAVSALEGDALDAVVPNPSQILAVGLNYRLHALESGLPLPEVPLVFTKFPSSVAAPVGIVELPTDAVDWEVEVAVVIGVEARRVSKADAWSHVAGITAAQDYSARDVQLAGGAKPQFSLGKSFEGFTPLGPVLVTPDEYEDRDAIALSCSINGEVLQNSSTSDLVFDVATLVSYLSHIVTLRPGDVILTGTPSGVGLGFNPPRYLSDGDVVVTTVELAGELRQVARTPAEAFDAVALLA
ncbi:fumarylacetoacetate hydrolase [Nocardioides baekrokdamisoli]|uniref:Fumarylacetoacetate hydrolase n=1 Tax=Nocardioides baekrokdamisoli TaxID=1804624 RepID=A0A3G9IH73_9ACTN|nr:fumarylacetoacetate hydrolase family protein [Nocardioides baekrokdamisoli]BBH17552.1 fumarylacetoacetate hydrolase [Nocardioides baekrokdamisoli]